MTGLMPQLNLKLSRTVAEQDEQMYFDHITLCALEGMWPFQPRSIDIMVSYVIVENCYKLIVEARFQDMTFRTDSYFQPGAMATDPDEEISRMGREIVWYLRNRPIISRDQHKLGEE